MKRHFIFLLLIAGILQSQTSFGKAKFSAPDVGTLKMNKDYVADAGCTIEEKSGKTIFVDLDQSGHPIMRLDGKKVSVKIDPASKPLSTYTKKGDGFSTTYSFKDIKITFDGKVSWVCPASSESCEVTRYDVTMIVKRGSNSKKTTGLKGSCGS